jgi:hypothetical protein
VPCQGCCKLKIPVIDFETGGEIRGVCFNCYGSRIPCCGPLDGIVNQNLDLITIFILNEDLNPPEILDQNEDLKTLVLTLATIQAQEGNNEEKMNEMLKLMGGLKPSDLFATVLCGRE